MSSATDTVDQFFQWLGKVRGVTLPALPYPPRYRRLASLFGLSIAAPLPPPAAPLPWDMPVSGDWPLPLDGVAVVLSDIRIHVADSPAVPTAAPHPSPTAVNQES